MNPQKGLTYFGIVGLLGLLLLGFTPAAGRAETITVNSTADAGDANLLNAVCETEPGNGVCTLRAAIQTANRLLSGPDTIILPAGTYTLAIAGAGENAALQGDLNINGLGGSLTITGAGAATTIIDGGALDGVFETRAGAIVTISDVTIRNGNGTGGLGGGIHVGNGTTLTLSRAVVTACSATGGAPGAGGIDNSGTLTLDAVAVTNNDSDGGGINNGALALLTWTNGEVSGNTTGGGIQNNGTIHLTNVTISGNTSASQGAGIDSRGIVDLTNVTISNNTSSAGPTAIGGIRDNGGVSTTVKSTVISGNLPANCGGTITSQGNNIDSGNTCLFADSGDLPNTDPLLGSLANNGGALRTVALLIGSPAIDSGATGTASGCPAEDARGTARPVDGNTDGTAACDMGAFEFRPQQLTVTPQPPIDFGPIPVDLTADRAITLNNAGDGDLIISALTVAAPFSFAPDGSCNTTSQTLHLGESCTLVSRFTPTATIASSLTFTIPSNDPVTPAFPFALSGTGTADPVPIMTVTDSIVPANDQLLPFGGVSVGGSADATIIIVNSGTANLVIGAIAVADALAAPFGTLNDACSGQTIAPQASCTLTIRFAPTDSTPAGDTFDIPAAGVPTVTMTVSGSGGISTTGNNPPLNPVLVSPANGQTGVGTSTTFIWNKSIDPDGDTVTYQFFNCADPTFAGCPATPVTAASAGKFNGAGLGGIGASIIVIGFALGGGLKRSRRLLLLAVTTLLLAGTVLMSCGKSSDDGGAPSAPVTPTANQMSATVTNLAGGTTYYWRVVADDGKGGQSSSATWSYTTQ